jgi:hypothetical protein
VLVHERADPGLQVLCPLAVAEVHGCSLCVR